MKESMTDQKPIFKCLTIAGSDSGGCAGIQADLKTFAAHNTFGMSVITALTSQNTMGVTYIMPAEIKSVETQLDAVMSDIGADAVKTGMLGTEELIETIAAGLKKWKVTNYVLDPVMVATTGAKLLPDDAKNAIVKHLFPLAKVITPNILEAEVFLDMEITDRTTLQDACKKLIDMGAQTVVIKGGHAKGRDINPGLDLWYDGREFCELAGEWIETENVHGTGCTYSSAIAANLAKQLPIKECMVNAKRYITGAIKSAKGMTLGHGNGAVNHFWDVFK